MLYNHRLREDSVGIAKQILKQRQFAGLQIDFPPAANHFSTHEIEREIAGDEPGSFGLRAGAANKCPETCHELGESEGLNQVVVTTGLQAANSLVDRPLGAQNKNRRVDPGMAKPLD